MTEYVIRIQDAQGRGPFKPGFSKYWLDAELAPGRTELPTWMEEFGTNLISDAHRQDYQYGSAVRSFHQLGRWFSDDEITRLYGWGYSIVQLRADVILAESKNQLVFGCKKPFYKTATGIELGKYLNPGALIVPYRLSELEKHA